MAIGLVVEVSKQDDEGYGITNQCPVHPVGEGAVDVEREGCMANRHVELDLTERKTRGCFSMSRTSSFGQCQEHQHSFQEDKDRELYVLQT